MSQRLNALERTSAQRTFANDDERLAWLNHMSFETDGTVGPAEWEETLNNIARHLAGSRGIGMIEAWFLGARTLVAAVADPDDKLYGITLAVHASNCGIAYDDARTYAKLFRLYVEAHAEEEKDEAEGPSEEAFAFYEYVSYRLSDMEMAISEPLRNGSDVPRDALTDPEVLVAGGNLLWDAIEDHQGYHEDNGCEPMDDAEVVEYIRFGGHYLWAAHHARKHGVERDELTRFVCVFADEWFEIMDDLVRRGLLTPGVLDAYVETDGSASDTIARGPELVACYQAADTDMTLTEYFNCCLAAVEQNA